MAWGSQGQVFLGEDLMHTRDYSEDTSRVIDDEVERILRTQEERAMELLTRHRSGLDAVAHALLEEESIPGEEVGRLVDEANGGPVHTNGAKARTIQFNGNGRSHGANGHDPAELAAGSGPSVDPSAGARYAEPARVAGAPQPPAGAWPPPWPQHPGWQPDATASQGGPPPQWPSPPGEPLAHADPTPRPPAEPDRGTDPSTESPLPGPSDRADGPSASPGAGPRSEPGDR